MTTVVQEYGGCIVSEGIAMLIGESVRAICPRINDICQGYKQNRLERNITRALFHLSRWQAKLEERLLNLESNEKTKQYSSTLSEILLDQIVDEIQEQKVDYNVNGYTNLIIELAKEFRKTKTGKVIFMHEILYFQDEQVAISENLLFLFPTRNKSSI